MLNIGIMGSTGYAGAELLRLLTAHPQVKIKFLGSHNYAGQEFSNIYQNFAGSFNDQICSGADLETMSKECDVVFLALPNGIALTEVNEGILSKAKIIDLSADFRLKDADVYEKWYNKQHKSKELLSNAVYGLCEINCEKIKCSRLIANPGCYATCSILALYPLLEAGIVNFKDIIIDAMSGVSGAGRAAELGSLFCEVNETTKAYKVISHRHTPEIKEQLSVAAGAKVSLIFTPHLVPMNRGILVTVYAKLTDKVTYEEVLDAYRARYAGEYFIRMTKKETFPETRWVKASNFCDIGFALDEDSGRIIIVAAIDNLVKGAAGQAVQNMNIMFELDEKMGLENVPVFPC
ncbi:MAG: N-acetyl-gamma-glutamyl-phosphate reductase [Oscillospiraceae bacterium]|nr:N-acetyl-gamma-glutamyl-phosphate reductase [Oscillospiraceae bacterium]